MFCTKCGKELSVESIFCPLCGTRIGGETLPKKSAKTTVAGVLDIVAVALGVIILPAAFVNYLDRGGLHVINRWATWGFVVPLGILFLVGMIIAVIGGVYTLRRERFGWALAGAVCATLFGVWFLGLIAITLISLSREEFQRPTLISTSRIAGQVDPKG